MLVRKASFQKRRSGVLSGFGILLMGLAALLIIFFGYSSLDRSSSLLYLGGILLVLALIVLFPALRLSRTQVLSPRNLMLLSISLKIMIVPVLIAFFGYSQGVFPNLPAISYIHSAQGIYILAAFCCLTGFIWGFRRPYRENHWVTPNWLMWSIILLSFSAALLYPFLNLQQLTNSQQISFSNSIGSTIILFLRGLAPLGVFYLLFRHQRYHEKQIFSVFQALFGLFMVVAVSLSTNRANIIYPALAFFTVYSLYNQRIKYWQVIVAGVLALTAVFWAGQARERLILGEAAYQQRKHFSQMTNAVDNAQVYFNGPQFGGYALRDLNHQKHTAFSSFVESFPKIGEAFRNSSGSYWFNLVIYRNTGIRDQVYPAQIETFNNYGWPGILFLYFSVGYCLALLQRVFESARRNPFLAYISAYLTLLLCGFINLSLSVMGQFLIYSAFPLLIFWLWMNFRKYT